MWFGLFIMVAMIVGLIWWCIWAVRREKEVQGASEKQEAPEK